MKVFHTIGYSRRAPQRQILIKTRKIFYCGSTISSLYAQKWRIVPTLVPLESTLGISKDIGWLLPSTTRPLSSLTKRASRLALTLEEHKVCGRPADSFTTLKGYVCRVLDQPDTAKGAYLRSKRRTFLPWCGLILLDAV